MDQRSAATVTQPPHTCVPHAEWIDGVRSGDDDRNDEITVACPACRDDVRRAAAIHALEDGPLDPEVDLAEVLIGHPEELQRLRAEQARIRQSPFYVLAWVRGREYRDELLTVATRSGRFDADAALGYFVDVVCTCASDVAVLFEESLDDNPCVWCRLRVELEAATHSVRRWAGEVRGA
ncbi:hypothetical protein [Pseudonocardia dioxanivorans]|uniref:hypothetical protein n=1 Tax=Pseudonocardia dioxanivorans TaxID=240495 RepID=UPI000CCFFDCE|nr:hypothetical protein [Pseudonocardia dioxanivorans]